MGPQIGDSRWQHAHVSRASPFYAGCGRSRASQGAMSGTRIPQRQGGPKRPVSHSGKKSKRVGHHARRVKGEHGATPPLSQAPLVKQEPLVKRELPTYERPELQLVVATTEPDRELLAYERTGHAGDVLVPGNQAAPLRGIHDTLQHGVIRTSCLPQVVPPRDEGPCQQCEVCDRRGEDIVALRMEVQRLRRILIGQHGEALCESMGWVPPLVRDYSWA